MFGDLVRAGYATVKWGSKGSDVTFLQESLNKLGFNAGTPDGIFGDKTFYAVRNFQQSQGLNMDGIVGSQTWGAIAAELASQGQVSNNQPPSATPVSSGSKSSSTSQSGTLAKVKQAIPKIAIPKIGGASLLKNKKVLIGGGIALLLVGAGVVFMSQKGGGKAAKAGA